MAASSTPPVNSPQALAAGLAPSAAELATVLATAAAGSVNPAALIALIAQLLPGAITLYQTIAAQYSGPTKTVEEILGQADANWDAIAAAAKGQL